MRQLVWGCNTDAIALGGGIELGFDFWNEEMVQSDTLDNPSLS